MPIMELPGPEVVVNQMSESVEEMLAGRLVLQRALASLLASYRRDPHLALARTIKVVRAQIALVSAVLRLHDADLDKAA